MYFSTTTVASALALILATSMTVSAQETPSEACAVCIVTHAIAASPSCDATLLGLTPPTTPPTPEQQKACYCPLTTESEWYKPCAGPDVCSPEVIASLVAPLEQAKTTVCAGGATPPPTTDPNPVPPPVASTTTAAPPKATTTAPAAATTTTAAAAKPTGKSGAAGALLGTSSKVLAGAALGVVSAAFLLL
ncbi:hypothetical protein BGZ95_010005 [Linnemannia exigua]|uniref:Uncharacterized protein n=1 Tax=Linnemannia exigua TaxID=604196 RepID=A0AAD4H674_9FUNG|nr:hypothetical protein BGZ95_010005 [Linnemannia exigua]